MTSNDERDLLARELRERSTAIGGHPIGLDDVRGRARSIRRRRNAVRGSVAAVVLAVAVPVGLTATDLIDSTQPTPAPPATTGSVQPSPSPSVRAGAAFRLTLEQDPTQTLPGVSYVHFDQRVLVTPDGMVDLPQGYSMITPYAGGWLAVGSERSPEDVVMLDENLEVTRTAGGGTSLAVSRDGSHVAYTEQRSPGQVRLVNAPTDGGVPVVTWMFKFDNPDDAIEPVGFLDNDTVVYQDQLSNKMGIAHTGDGGPIPIEGFLRLDDASEANGLVSGLVSYDVDGGCSGVMDPMSGDLLWQSCDYSGLQFSPDGRYVTALASYFDGPGSPSVSVLDARTGKPVVKFESEGRDVVGVSQVVWEDDSSLLIILAEGTSVGMVRARLDGSMEKMIDPIEVQDMSMPIWFAEEPR